MGLDNVGEPGHRSTRSLRTVIAFVLLAAVLVGACSSDEVAFDTRSAAGGAAQVALDGSGELETGGQLPEPAGAGTAQGETGTGGSQGPIGPGTPSGGEPIRLGTILPLQGGERDFGEPILRTTQAFIDEVNARGGVLGRPLELIAYNACLLCQGDALTAARRLVEQDQVFALVNTYPMVVAFQPVIPYLVDHGVPLIQGGSFSQTSDALSPINFATAPSGLFYGRWVPVTAARTAKMTRAAIVYLDVPTETNGLPLLRRELRREGVEVVAEASVAAAEDAVTNMDSIVTRFRAAGADGVVALDPAVLIFGRLAARRQGWSEPWVGPAAWSLLVESGCGRTCDDNVYTDSAGLSFTNRQSPQMGQFLDTMGRRYPGGQITGHTLAAWVGMQLLLEGITRAGDTDRAELLAALESIRNLDLGTTSPLTFTPDRHLGGTATILLHLENGRFVAMSGPQSFGEARP